VKHDQTGLGKNTQDVEMIESTVAQRRELDSEKFARWTKDQKLKLQVCTRHHICDTTIH
jgi:hypothetical protein